MAPPNSEAKGDATVHDSAPLTRLQPVTNSYAACNSCLVSFSSTVRTWVMDSLPEWTCPNCKAEGRHLLFVSEDESRC